MAHEVPREQQREAPTFGPYPEVKLGEARDKRDAARAMLRDGRDPSVQKKVAAAAAP